MSRYWLSELLVSAALVLAALWLGWLFGHLPWFLLLALLVVLFRWARQLYRLDAWLHSRRRHPPDSWGLWGEIFDSYYRMRRRQHRNKQRLAAVIREFREATAAMPDGTLVLDREFRIVWCNQAACRLVQLTSSRDLGQPVTNLIRSPQFVAYLDSSDFDDPVEIRSPVDDSRRLMLRLVPYGNRQYLLLIRDVTRLHRLQAMRRDFVANASHELRSPLTVLGGYLDSLAGDRDLAPDWQQPVREMQAQCQRMNNLVNDLLELSRLETEDAEAPVDQAVGMPALIERVVNSAGAADNDRHRIALELDGPQNLAGVEGELHSALSNLVVNALRYSPEETTVRVAWRKDAAGSGAVFEVSDEGIGIEARHLPFITQRFYRADSSHSRSKGGTGLGLAIVKHVLNRHGARLAVESTPGGGSTFRCHFPAERIGPL